MNKSSNTLNYFEELKLNKPGSEYEDISRIIVVSDLHASEGKCPETGIWDRLENFTAGQHFEKFLQKKLKKAQKEKKKYLLVINGDFIDFLRIRRTPQSMKEMEEWKSRVEALTDKGSELWEKFNTFYKKWERQVPDSKTKPGKIAAAWNKLFPNREKKYGFETENYKSVYRLLVAFEGHPQLFDALAEWLAAGMMLVFVTGNHDLELTQKLVQKCLRHELEARALHMGKIAVTNSDFSQTLKFFEQGVEIDDQIRIEHGHRYEWHTRTENAWKKNDITEKLCLPQGSLYNLYLVNDLEKIIPHIDNVKPNTRIVTYILKNHPSKILQALKIILCRIYPLSRKRTLRLFRLGLMNVALIIGALVTFGWLLSEVDIVPGSFFTLFWQETSFFGLNLPWFVLMLHLIIGFVLFYYLIDRKSPHFSTAEVKSKMNKGLNSASGKRHYAVCGHTHRAHIIHWNKPDEPDTIYFNSGSWSMVYEYEYGFMLRNDLANAFVEFETSSSGNNNWNGKLMRWLADTDMEAEMIILKQPEDEESSKLKALIEKLIQLLKDIKERLKKWSKNGHTKHLPNLVEKN